MTTRTTDEIWAELTHTLTTAVLAGDLPDAERMSALWSELGAAADGSVPAWAQVAAMMLADRYASDARLVEHGSALD